MASYAGSAALSPEAREKVLQTFRHTLSLAQSGKADEALLGCDFILKMDARFAPARALLDALRTAAPGAPVDVNRFSEFLGFDSAVEAPHSGEMPLPPKAPPLGDAFPSPAPSVSPGSGLDDLVFGEDGGMPSPSPSPRPAPLPAPVSAPPLAPAAGADPFAGLDDLSLGSGPPSGAGSPLEAAFAGVGSPDSAPEPETPDSAPSEAPVSPASARLNP